MSTFAIVKDVIVSSPRSVELLTSTTASSSFFQHGRRSSPSLLLLRRPLSFCCCCSSSSSYGLGKSSPLQKLLPRALTQRGTHHVSTRENPKLHADHTLSKYLLFVDNLQKLGICRYFREDVKQILEDTYRIWVQMDDEIFSDIGTIALAFRLLRTNGYEISSNVFVKIVQEDSLELIEENGDLNVVLELYHCSQIKVSPEDDVLDELYSWSRQLLMQKFSSFDGSDVLISSKVEHALKYPFQVNVDRLEQKKTIENFDTRAFDVLESLSRSETIEDVLKLAVDDFSAFQYSYLQEFQLVESWVKERDLERLEYARIRPMPCYFCVAIVNCQPHMFDVRMTWAKAAILCTIIDDFFDIGSTPEEQYNFFHLVKSNERDYSKCVTENVRILYSALQSTMEEVSSLASSMQGRDVTNKIVDLWTVFTQSMINESEWKRKKKVPTVEEYLENGQVSVALVPTVLPSLYYVDQDLTMDLIEGEDCANLTRLTGTIIRLCNDVVEREIEEKHNTVSLHILNGLCSSSEEAEQKIIKNIEELKAKLLRLVLFENEGTFLPRAQREMFWKMCKVMNLFYREKDEISSPKETLKCLHTLVHEPLKVPQL